MTILRAFSLTCILVILVAGSFRPATVPESSSAVPLPAQEAFVVTELFTSEGCSSCPPADDVLSRLVQQQPVPNVTVLALSENVDYWNRLGWVDPFSSPVFSQRQSEYATQVFRSVGVYTPQLVIDGNLEEVGSNAGGVYRKIGQAAKIPKAALKIAATLSPDSDVLQVQFKVDVPPEAVVRAPANVMLAVTEDNLASNVHRGENNGRLLRHNAVVRSLQTVGDLAPPIHMWSKTTATSVAREWKPANLKVIGFLQEQQSWRIIGAGWSEVESPAVK
jgi:hypothetical protein